MPTYGGINGARRELREWPVGVDGVVRQQEEVWAGISGVKRQIFSYSSNITITIVGDGGPYYGGYARATINGTVYYQGATIQVPAGTTIKVEATNTRYGYYPTITFNGSLVGTNGTDESGMNNSVFSTALNSDTKITISVQPYTIPYYYYVGFATITGGT